MRYFTSRRSGFSLIEVVMAMGIASFAMVAIYGMVPVSLQSLKRADDRMTSTMLFKSLSQSIRDAGATNGIYKLAGSFAGSRVSAMSGVSWQIGGGQVTLPATQLGETGEPLAGATARYVVAGQITPPASSGGAGLARLSVAWPASAKFDPATFTWANAAGSKEITLYFLPTSL